MKFCRNYRLINDHIKILLPVILISVSISINAQRKIDSLKNLISNTKTDTAKIDLYEKLGDSYRNEKKMDSSVLSYQHALEINERSNYSLQRQSWNLAALDYIFYEMGNYNESLKYALIHFNLSKKLNDTAGVASAHLVFGHDYRELGNYRLSLDHYFKAYHFWEIYHKGRNQPPDNTYTILCISATYLRMKEADSALLYAKQGYALGKTASDGGYILLSERLLGDIYFAKGDDGTALHYYRQYIPDFVKYEERNRDLGFAFNSMAKIFQKRNQNDSAIFYAKKALSNAQEYQDQQNIYDAAIMLYNSFKNINVYTANYAEDDTLIDNKNEKTEVNTQITLRKKIDSLQILIANTKIDTGKIGFYENLAQAYRDDKRLDSSIITYKRALELNQKNNYSPLRQCYNMSTIDYLYYVTGNYTKSLEYASKVLVLSERLHDLPQMAHAHQQFGFNYVAFGDYRQAINHFFKAKQLFELHNHPEIDLESPAFATTYIGYIYLKMKQPDSALIYVQKGYQLASKMSLRYVIDYSLRMLGDIYLVKNKDQLSLNYYRQYISDFYKYDENNRDIDFVFYNMANIFKKRNQNDSAIFYAKKALQNAKEYNDQENIYNASSLLYSLHNSLNNESEAFRYFKIATTAKDSMASIDKIRQIQMLTFNEQTREKELEEADAKEAERTKLIIIIASVTGLIISILAWTRIRQLRLKHTMILEQKEAEKLRAIDRMKEKFFTNITHELRTPLSLIMSPAEFYLQHPEELDDTPKFLESIYKNSGYLLNLINQLLDISKLDAGKMNISLSKGDFGNYINDILKTFEEDAAKKQIGLSFESDLHGDYLFDPEQWKKITSNLLSNALKFTPPGGAVFVTLKKITDSVQSATIQLAVKDSGIGINKEQLPFLTDRFYQADHHLTRKYEGTGIGLSLVNELVKLMNGTLEIKSEEGKGAVFSVSATLLSAQGKEGFPALPSLATSIRFSSNCISPKNILRNTEKNIPVILVAEDNPELNDFIKNSLDNLYHVITVSNGAEGFEIASLRLPDVIISDVMMPVMDGFKFCDKIKTNPTTSHIPFIILSAKTTYESRMTGLQKGADDYLTKPFSVEELLSKIKNILKRQERLKTTYENKLFELEAKALRAQMNPHFVFNCLNSIKALMQEGETEKGVKYLTTFSKLIRTLFNNADKKEISLYDEIETCKFYLQLEAMRFDAAFNYSINADPEIDLKSVNIPALIIQPFIENAIWHGIVPGGAGGNIRLDVERNNGYVEIIVEDDGIGREVSQKNKAATKLTHDSKGVNLTQSRLELDNLLRQRHAKIEITDKRDAMGNASGTKVIIKIEEDTE